jgi:hypothetical protein
MVLTFKNKFNLKYGFDKDEPHTVEEISKLTNYDLEHLKMIVEKGKGAYFSNHQSVRPHIKSPEEWGMARLYASLYDGSKSNKIDKSHLIKKKLTGRGIQDTLTKYIDIVKNNSIDLKRARQIELIPMGDDTIRKYYPNAKILTVSQLSQFNTIDDLLPNIFDYVFLLYENEQNQGHWVLLTKKNNMLEYFDSYAGKIDEPIKWNTGKKNIMLGQGRPYLTNLIKNSNYNVVVNHYDFQNDKDYAIATCGRWDIFRLNTIIEDNMLLPNFIKLVKTLTNRFHITNDELVSDIINKT